MKASTPKIMMIAVPVVILTLGGAGIIATGMTQSNSGSAQVDSYRHIQAPESLMADRAMMAKAAPSAGMSEGMRSMSAAPQSSERRIEESHSFRYKVEREAVADQYERAFNACAPDVCEVVMGNLNVQGVTKSANLTVRIEPNAFNSYMEAIGDPSQGVTLVNHSRSATDRTREYQDIHARMASQENLRNRLMNMVDSYHGQNIRSLLEIERELARVQGSIESMQAQLRGISARTDRITTSINFFSDHLEAAPERPPYMKNAMKEIGAIFEKSAAKVLTFTAAFAPILIGLVAIVFVFWALVSVVMGARRLIKFGRTKS